MFSCVCLGRRDLCSGFRFRLGLFLLRLELLLLGFLYCWLCVYGLMFVGDVFDCIDLVVVIID